MSQNVLKLNADIISTASIVGQKEKQGPLSPYFDTCDQDGNDRFGQDTFERAEAEMQCRVATHAMARAGLIPQDIDMIFAGDLMNQCTGSAYGLCDLGIPFGGLYGACSTCAESLLLGSVMVTSRHAVHAMAVTSSHNAASERQFRFPLEYGGQRPPTAQWTVTGSGAFILGQNAPTPIAHIKSGMVGIPIDSGISDAANMGAAMAPAALSTLLSYLQSTHTSPHDYDLIVTGDLGYEGGRILQDLSLSQGVDISQVYNDCGMMIYSQNTQDTHCGGSGCGCSAVVLSGYLLPKIQRGEIRQMLFMATGALMSPDALKQGRSIIGIAHLICIEAPL